MSFSYGRALTAIALRHWRGHDKYEAQAQEAFLARARANSLAALGIDGTEETAPQ